MVISHAFCNDNFRIFDIYKPIMTERLIVHTHGLHTCMPGYCFYYFTCSSLYFPIVRIWYLWYRL